MSQRRSKQKNDTSASHKVNFDMSVNNGYGHGIDFNCPSIKIGSNIKYGDSYDFGYPSIKKESSGYTFE